MSAGRSRRSLRCLLERGVTGQGEARSGNLFLDSRLGCNTYSSYARGLGMLIGAYHLLDIVPKGRDEDTLDFSMEWIRHHDRYDEAGP